MTVQEEISYLGIRVYSDQIGYGVVTEQHGNNLTICFENEKTARRCSADRLKRYYSVLPGQTPSLKKEEWQDFKSVEEFVNYYIRQLEFEIEDSKTRSASRIELFNGVCLNDKAEMALYSFQTDSDARIPLYYPLNISTVDGKNLKGECVFKNENEVHLIIEENIGKTADSVFIYTDPTFLLETLIDNLQTIVPQSELVRKIILDKELYLSGSSQITCGQQNACERAVNNEISFIWGPPGTGKTTTIASIAERLLHQGFRVLILSNNNIAVDNAVAKIGCIPGFEILRYGHTLDKQIKEAGIDTFSRVLAENEDLRKQRETILDELQKPSLSNEQIQVLRKQLVEIRDEIRDYEMDYVREADLIGTTLAKASLQADFFNQAFDVVIIDEISAASIPSSIAGLALAKSKFIGLGDFCQLGPIASSHEADALKYNLFDFSYITKAIRRGKSHDWLTMLDTQYRMAEEIANLVSKPVYSGLLKSAPQVGKNNHQTVEKSPFPNRAVVRIDCSGYGFMAIKRMEGKSNSWLCLESAITSVFLAAAFDGSCAIITPFRKQAQLIRSLLKNINHSRKESVQIECSTIHSFQGSEKEMVIIDLVQNKNSLSPVFLGSREERNRLLNVAITRAKGKVIILGCFEYLHQNAGKDSLLYQLTEPCSRINPDELFQEIKDSINNTKSIRLFKKENAEAVFTKDLRNAKISVDLSCPMRVKSKEIPLFNSFVFNPKLKLRARKGTDLSLESFETEEGTTNLSYCILDRKVCWINYPFSMSSTALDPPENSVIRIENEAFARYLRKI